MRYGLLLLVFLVTPVSAQEPPQYQDDRSSATALIQSLYNAINRGEYLRAWSYYGENAYAAPSATVSADFDTFKDGYADTTSVTLLTGPQSQEGAAGSTFFSVPTAIDAVDEAGRHTQFVGCYVVRLVQPAIQESPPFHPLHIESGALEPAEGNLEAILPKSCES